MDRDEALLVTLELDAESMSVFERLRRAHYPAERNRVPAHVMLFHRLPLERKAAIASDLAAAASGAAPFTVDVSSARSIGSGVSFDLRAPALDTLRAALARNWQADLTPQDRQGFRPHVVVQNKVTSAVARETLERLRNAAPFAARAIGLELWHYRSGGTWHDRRTFAFATN